MATGNGETEEVTLDYVVTLLKGLSSRIDGMEEGMFNMNRKISRLNTRAFDLDMSQGLADERGLTQHNNRFNGKQRWLGDNHSAR